MFGGQINWLNTGLSKQVSLLYLAFLKPPNVCTGNLLEWVSGCCIPHMSWPQDHFSMEQFLRSIFQETHSVWDWRGSGFNFGNLEISHFGLRELCCSLWKPSSPGSCLNVLQGWLKESFICCLWLRVLFPCLVMWSALFFSVGLSHITNHR